MHACMQQQQQQHSSSEGSPGEAMVSRDWQNTETAQPMSHLLLEQTGNNSSHTCKHSRSNSRRTNGSSSSSNSSSNSSNDRLLRCLPSYFPQGLLSEDPCIKGSKGGSSSSSSSSSMGIDYNSRSTL
ncbi:hypothetical protein ACSSS7_001076 [Eimeria intestinalis]